MFGQAHCAGRVSVLISPINLTDAQVRLRKAIVGVATGDAPALRRGWGPDPGRGPLLRRLWRGRLARVAQCPLSRRPMPTADLCAAQTYAPPHCCFAINELNLVFTSESYCQRVKRVGFQKCGRLNET
jgi:hypothetical protein